MPIDPVTGKWIAGGLMTAEDSVQAGLTGAAGLIANQPANPYPGYVPSQATAPSQQGYMNYTPNQPMAQITTPNYQLNTSTPNWQNTNFNTQNVSSGNATTSPYSFDAWGPLSGPTYERVNTQAQTADWKWNPTTLSMERVTNPYTAYTGTDPAYQKLGTTPTYQGLMGGDYNALQTALQTPGEIAAKTAYDQGQTNLTNQMGGQGLYGSSIMSNQARTALETPYQNTLATNAANAAATRYAQQAADLQNQNTFGLNVYGQQMGENQTANQQGYNTWNARMNENLAGQGYGLEAQKSNQATNANLQGLLSQQGIAQNTAGLDYAKLGTATNLANVNAALSQAQNLNSLASSDTQNLQRLYQNTNQQMNAQNLDYAKLATGVGQTNVANNLAAQQSNQSANTAANSLLMNQGLAQNAQNQNTYNQQMAQSQAANQYGLNAAGQQMTQAQNTYTAGANDAARQQDYNLAAQTYANAGTEQQRQWANQQAVEKFQYDLASGQYTNQQMTEKINQYLALAGRGQVTAGQNAATTAQQNAQSQAAQSDLWQGLLSLGVNAATIAAIWPK